MEGVVGSAIAPWCGWNGLLPSWAKMFARTCWITTANHCLQCIVYFCSTIFHFPYSHKTLQVNHCCSHGTALKKKEKKRRKPANHCVYRVKIVINRACLKKKKSNCCLFSCIKENLWQKNLAVRNVIRVYISEYGTNWFIGIYFNVN